MLKTYIGEGTSPLVNGAGKLDIYMQKIKK
jgi:hypothetical protein